MKFKPLPNKRVKEIKQILKKTYGFESPLDYVFFSNESKIYLISNDIKNFDFDKVRINSIGLYFGEINDRNQMRLSIEGSQLVGPHSSKNIIELDDDQAKAWMKGEEPEIASEIDNFILIKHNNDFLGCGKPKKGKILNFVPKARRVSMD